MWKNVQTKYQAHGKAKLGRAATSDKRRYYSAPEASTPCRVIEVKICFLRPVLFRGY
jgi:hypothetical protein